MSRNTFGFACILLCLTSMATAQEIVLRPVARAQTILIASAAMVRPLPRSIQSTPSPHQNAALVGPLGARILLGDHTVYAIANSMLPRERPAGITQAAMALEAERRRGSVCNDPAIQGVARGRVEGRGACGIDSAVEVRSISGINLSSPVVIDCQTATALRNWVQNSAIPQLSGQGGGLAELQILGAYSCRTRNNVPGARLSEHSFGRALDIGGFVLRDGTHVSVLRGWNGSVSQRLRQMHRDACGPFGTVLGPNANAAHRDHFHFDTARYRSGSYCR